MTNQPEVGPPRGQPGPAGPIEPVSPVGPEFAAYSQIPTYPQVPPYPSRPFAHQVYPGQPYPPYGYPYRPSTNGFAVAGFVCSFFGLIGILGIIFSCIALGQIRQRGQGGRGLAIAGLVIGSCWACLYLVGLIISLSTSSG